MNTAAAAVRQYSLDTLEAIRRDLGKNPRTYQPGSWESERNSAITTEIKRRLASHDLPSVFRITYDNGNRD